MIRFLFAALVLLAPVCAYAEDVPYALYAAGKYDEAIKAGTEQKTAWGYVVASRAALADAQTRADGCLDCLQRAIKYADHAVSLDNKMPDAHTFRAVAVGYKARLIGMIQARLHNDPKHAKEDLDKALAVDPKNVWALGALGGWNIEIVRAGGSYMANFFYGATEEAGLAAFEAALKAGPDNLPVRYQYMLSLAGYDSAHFDREIGNTLTLIAKMTPRTAYEKVAQIRAAQLYTEWKKGDRRVFGQLVRKYQGYPP
jgi:hypothetical protein